MTEKKMYIGKVWQDGDDFDDFSEAVAIISDGEYLHLRQEGKERPLINMDREQVAELVDWLFDHRFIKVDFVGVIGETE